MEKIFNIEEIGAILLTRDKNETACSYLERCLTPEMRKVWYEACVEIKEKIMKE